MNAVRRSLSLAAVVNAASSRRGPACDLHHLACILLSLGAVFASVIDANGADFTFGYRGVDSVGADSYLVARQNAQKYNYPYPSNDPLTYWGPSANGVPASLTYRFDFGKPSASVFVSASLASYNFVWGNANGWSGSGTGFNSLWASTDGLGWQLLLDNPTPANYVDSYKTYEQYLPSSLLGSSSLWVQVRMQADNAPLPTYTTSQFSRTSASRATDVFRIEAVSVPEPSTYAMALAGIACGGFSMWRRRKRVSSYRLFLLAAIVTVTEATAATPVFAQSVNYEIVPVGDPGNANDPATGNLYGAVAYDYQIGKYEVTISEYTDFLNAVAATDTYSLYNASMATNLNVAGIAQTGSSGSYTYSVIAPSGTTPAGASSPGNRPITYVSWFDSARFANWMANGQPTGAQSSTTTENGAYVLSGTTTAPAKNVTNPNTSAAPTFFIPNENEWYKAAYFDPTLNSGSGGYYTYATQSNADPGNSIGGLSNQANYIYRGSFTVTPSKSSSQNYLTDVGAFTNSGSYYGTFDQSGNVFEWNDLTGTAGLYRGLRGGFFHNGITSRLSSSERGEDAPTTGDYDGRGFRLASPVAVPEPSTYAMALAGLACGGYSIFRRRERA